MENETFLKRFYLDSSVVDKAGFNPYYPVLQSSLGNTLLIENEEFINLATNNYLGLADDARVKEASIKAICDYGLSYCATPIAGGACKIYNDAAGLLSSFTGVVDCIIYPSCYQANNALFKIIAGKNDIILVDHYAHSSLVEGIKAAPCKFRPFLHNNIQHLEELLQKSGDLEQVFVVTESVFSTEGSIAPLKEMNELCNKYNAVFVIDDSHGIGVIGDKGKGAVSCISNFNGIYTASLGKAIANSGGMIGGNRTLIDFLRYNSSHLIYSTAIVPSILGGIIKIIEIIEEDFSNLKDKMFCHKKIIQEALLKAGFTISKSETPIISIESGNSEQTMQVAYDFYKNKILTTPFIFPSVPEKQGRKIGRAHV